MKIEEVVELYQLIGGDFLAQLFATKLSYSELYICATNLLLSKSIVPVKHAFIRIILGDLTTTNWVKKSFWTGKYELTCAGRQKVIGDIQKENEQ